jgi:hypothetical protein
MFRIICLLFLLNTALLVSCQKKQSADSQTESAETKNTQQEIDISARTEEIIEVRARLENVNDAGYPQAFLSYLPEEAQEMSTLNFNQEEGIRIEDLQPFLGKEVMLKYKKTKFIDAYDIQFEGKSLLQRPSASGCLKELRGTLNAPEITKGDLPSEYSIQTADGKSYTFETFITPEMAAAHGKEVTACLINAENEELISFKAK